METAVKSTAKIRKRKDTSQSITDLQQQKNEKSSTPESKPNNLNTLKQAASDPLGSGPEHQNEVPKFEKHSALKSSSQECQKAQKRSHKKKRS